MPKNHYESRRSGGGALVHSVASVAIRGVRGGGGGERLRGGVAGGGLFALS
jgi:hypothetical protein